MQEVVKTRHSTIEGVMMAVKRLDVPINGQCHLRSAPHGKSSGPAAAASGGHFEHTL